MHCRDADVEVNAGFKADVIGRKECRKWVSVSQANVTTQSANKVILAGPEEGEGREEGVGHGKELAVYPDAEGKGGVGVEKVVDGDGGLVAEGVSEDEDGRAETRRIIHAEMSRITRSEAVVTCRSCVGKFVLAWPDI